MLTLEKVHSGYLQRPVLLGVDLTLAAGSTTALLGRNGVGKSTLMKTIMGLLDVTSGTVEFEESVISSEPAHRRARRGIAYVPQGRHVFGPLTVEQNLRVAAEAVFGRGWKHHVDVCLAEYPQLQPKATVRAGSLSGGQQQILALARATITQPRLLILDEPTEGIAPAVLEELVALIRGLCRDRGLALLLAEQNLSFAASLTTDAVLLDRGRVALRTSMEEVIASDEVQSKFLAL